MQAFLNGLCLLIGLACATGPVAAQEPARTFKFASAEKRVVGLNMPLELELSDGKAFDVKKAKLWIANHPLGIEPTLGPDGKTLIFQLKRTEGAGSNREAWATLLGSPFAAHAKAYAISLHHGDQPIAIAANSGKAEITLVRYDGIYMGLGLLAAIVVIVAVVYLGSRTTMLRDGGAIPQIPPGDRPYSLGRIQMAIWFCLILSSFLLIAIVMNDLNSINSESFILLGISATTALAAVAIDRSKDAETVKLREQLGELGLKTSKDVEDLKAKASKTDAEKAAWAAYEEGTRNLRTESLLKDLINDASGPTLHRFQILVWTIVLGAIYAILVYTDLETPTFGNNLLALMGLSGGIYLGFKIPEKQS